jgi:oligoendopeptidase F
MVETKSIPESEKWKKEHIFSSEEAWKKSYEEVSTRIDDIKHYQGNITNAKELLTYLTKGEEISQKYSKLYVYAMLSHDEDTRVADSQARLSKVQQLGVKLSSATSFFTPFLLSLDEQTLSTYILKKIYLIRIDIKNTCYLQSKRRFFLKWERHCKLLVLRMG